MIVLDFLAGLPSWLTPRRLLALALVAAALGWGAVRGVEAWWYRCELARAEREMDSGRYALARERLARVAAHWPGRDEVEYPLGVCEAALGHLEPALQAWARVPADSLFASDAALDRSRLALEHGRLAVAEESLARVLARRGAVGEQASRLARQLDLFSGRAYRINRRIEERWATAADQAIELRTHWLFDTQPPPMGPIGEYLERFGREAPDDDRVWLGRADLATRAGRYAEADDWLKQCEARRPDDPDVCRARLFWGLEAGRLDVVTRVLTRLSADRFSPAEIAALAARLAALRGDAGAERSALERRVELEPGDAEAWRRLADLATRAGSAGAELLDRARKRSSEIDRAGDQYRMWTGEVGIGNLAHLRELARTALVLGRRFEARGWWSLRARQAPDDREARAALDQMVRSEPPAKRSRADQGQTYDGDGWLDVFVVQGGRFPPTAGDAAPNGDPGGGYLAGMGIACGDFDGDGRPDLAVTNFYGESVTLYQNLGGGLFADCMAAGLAAPIRFVLGFGASFLDANNDGQIDLAVANGHVNDYRPAIPYAMPAQLFLGAGGGHFVDASARAGACWAESRVGRGLAVGDLDNDGLTDVLILAQNGPLAFFHNLGPGGHFLTLRLEGRAANRDGVGACVRVTAAGRTQTVWRLGGGSFLSASDDRLHFGLGATSRIEAIEVRWPSRRVDRYTDLAADTAYLLREGQPQASPLGGWRRPLGFRVPLPFREPRLTR